VDPPARRAADDRGLESEPLRVLQVLQDAGPELLEVPERDLALLEPFRHLAVERPADELLEMRHRVERRPDRSDQGHPEVEWKLLPVLAVELLPGDDGGALSVDDQAVEVEQKPANRHGVSLPEMTNPPDNRPAVVFGLLHAGLALVRGLGR